MTNSVSNPLAQARSISSCDRSRSFHRYSWNHRRPSPEARATSSADWVPIVDSANGIPAAVAAAAPASSPSECMKRVKPVGAIPNGCALTPRAMVTAGSTVVAPLRTFGTKVVSRKASRVLAAVTSASAAPST